MTNDQAQRSKEVLEFQLECLKLEINIIQQIIARIDNITQTTKNWAVVTWAGGLGLVLSREELHQFTIFVSLLPILFWYVDAHWRHLQRRSVFRQERIQEFLNDDRISESFREGKLVDFTVLDPVGRQYLGRQDFEKAVAVTRTRRYPEVKVFYGGLIIASVLIAWIVR